MYHSGSSLEWLKDNLIPLSVQKIPGLGKAAEIEKGKFEYFKF